MRTPFHPSPSFLPSPSFSAFLRLKLTISHASRGDEFADAPPPPPIHVSRSDADLHKAWRGRRKNDGAGGFMYPDPEWTRAYLSLLSSPHFVVVLICDV